MAMAWNISTILLLSRTSIAKSSIDLGVRFCGVSSLNPSLDDTALSHIYNFGPTFKAFASANPDLFYDTKIASGLWTLNDSSMKTTYGTWSCYY